MNEKPIVADIGSIGSGVPRIPLRRADDLVERIVALKADADARGFGTLYYFLEIARIEAQLQADRIADERQNEADILGEVWRPVTDRD
jgi:hypothetical protein